MAFEQIDSADDPRVADYRDLPDPELMRSRGLFMAEGRLVVKRLLDDGRYAVKSVLVSETARRDLGPALEAIAPQVPVYVCNAGDFLHMTGYDIHRGCLALVQRPAPTRLDELVTSGRLLIVLEGVTNADNVGGVFRAAAAFGADGIVLSPTCCDPLYRKAIRTSMAATLRVPFVRATEWPDPVARLHSEGFTLVALTPRQPSEALQAFATRPRPQKLALIVGTEGAGLSAEVETAADHRVSIPIKPEVDSLNLAVATGIALHRLTTG